MSRPDEENGTTKIEMVNDKVKAVADQMRINIESALERGEKLEVIETQAETLARQSREFERGARRVKNKMRCANYKTTALIVLIVLAVIALIIGLAYASRS